MFDQAVVAAAGDDRALRAQLIGDEFERGVAVIIEAAHEVGREFIGDPGSVEPGANLAEEILGFGGERHRRGAVGERAVARILAVEDAQRVLVEPGLAVFAQARAVRGELSEDSQMRLDNNPLRILDSKDPRDRPFADSAPPMVLTAEAEDFFGAVKAGLDAAGVDYEIAPHLVRGLDYYRHTAFEFVTDQLGAQGTVIAGGRYDGLIEQLGGPHTPAVGWAAGIERLAMLIDVPALDRLEVAVVAESEELEVVAIAATTALRRAGISSEAVITGSPRKRFDKALKLNAVQVFSLQFRNGLLNLSQRGAGATKADLERVSSIIGPVVSRLT